MAVHRLSVSLPENVERDIRRAAAQAGVSVSAWLADVASRAALVEDGRRAVGDHEAEQGAIGGEVRACARRVLDDLGVGMSERDAAAS